MPLPALYATMPPSRTLPVLIDELARRRERHIVIVDELPGPYEAVTFPFQSAWLRTSDADLIIVSTTISGVHRDHNIVHQLAHIVLGHDDQIPQLPIASAQYVPGDYLAAAPAPLSAHRTQHSANATAEAQAENLATQIMLSTRGDRPFSLKAL